MLSCWSNIPPIEVSSDQEQYYVLHQVSLTFSQAEGHLDIYSQTYPAQMYPLVEASSGQDQYYVRSA